MEGAKPSLKGKTKAFASASAKKTKKMRAENQYILRSKKRLPVAPIPRAMPVLGKRPQQPFFLQVSYLPETKHKGGLPVLTLPAGTVLFRGVRLPNVGDKEDARYFYRDYLGDPMPSGSTCVSSTHNTFFYPFPYLPFGTNEVGQRFHSMQAVVLVHPVTVVCSIEPSTWMRGDAWKSSSPDAPYARCINFDYGCRDMTAEELEARQYDNCLNPEFAQRSGVRGWMAIAAMDAIKSRKMERKSVDSTMLTFLKDLDTRFPGKGTELLASLYIDSNRTVGFPELAIYPYANHKGDVPIRHVIPNDQAAIRAIEKEASADNLNYLPLATFTQTGTLDMVKGLYDFRRVPITPDTFTRPPRNHQPDVEGHLSAWMDKAMTTGIKLPFYGAGTLSFDTRTGFYVLPQLVPRNLRVPVPDAALAVKGGAAAAAASPPSSIPYSYLLMPLDTPEARQLVLSYTLIFRTFYPEKLNMRYGLEKKVGVRRAMVLNRPPALKTLFSEIGVAIPSEWNLPLKRASDLYRAEKEAKETKDARVAAEEKEVAKVAAEQPLAIVADEPAYEESAFGAGAAAATTAAEGGARRQTRKKKHSPFDYIRAFTSVWKKHSLIKKA